MSGNRFHIDLHAFCALALVRRFYQSLVVGLAVFILTLVALREPFRGYLAEVRISGPVVEGLDLNAAGNWLKQADQKIAVVTSRGRDSTGRGQIRATFLAPRASAGTKRLDELAERWLYQYLPNRLMAYRHAALAQLRGAAQAAHEREDHARSRLEAGRQVQLAMALKEGLEARAAEEKRFVIHDESARVPEKTDGTHALDDRDPSGSRSPEVAEGLSAAVEKLKKLRLELAELLSNFTDQHPQVITLKAQVTALESQVAELQSSADILPRHGGRLRVDQRK